MKQQNLNKISILLVLFLLNLACCSTPPYIHKFPLQLTSNYVYYADLYFGTHGQNISLLVDTGSKTLAAFCTLCAKGCELADEFQIETSPSFENVTCAGIDQLLNETNFSPALRVCKSSCRTLNPNDTSQCKGQLSYGSSSLSSFLDYLLIRDLVSVNSGGLQVKSTFGCIYDERNFDTGIWGVALSPDNELLDEIYESDQARGLADAKKVFTICTSGKTAIMNIGGIDTSNHLDDGFTLSVNPYFNLWWNVKVNEIGRITHNSTSTVIRQNHEYFGSYGIIIDSGTDFIILPVIIANRISEVAEQLCQQVVGCTLMDPYEIFNLVLNLTDPIEYFSGEVIEFEIGDKKLATPLSNYFWNLGDGVWALAVVGAQTFNFEMSILGSIWMNNFDIAFNRQDGTVTIYDITGCESSSRRLQTEYNDDYDLPTVRGDRLDGVDAINKLKMKHQRSIVKMLNEKNWQ